MQYKSNENDHLDMERGPDLRTSSLRSNMLPNIWCNVSCKYRIRQRQYPDGTLRTLVERHSVPSAKTGVQNVTTEKQKELECLSK
jgi:hypothetical protein